MIRPATHDDVPRLIELGTALHQTSTYAAMAFIPEKAASFLHALIDGVGVIFVAEVGGEVVGGFAGAVTEQWFSDDLLAYDYSFFLDPKTRSGITATRLLITFIEWARIKGAKRIHIGITTGIHVSGTSDLYRSLGFTDAGLFFSKEL
ncbi:MULTISPECIES: GNAT family N-acetyltransferase [Pseudomonas syringae group]|uniref:GNAT family N-acetyltransferase n=1 Tax=Pseudomonas syringae group TaxID=136849 RepID=UPI000EFEF646|nr:MULTISPECIES: GNAT family N-acetyltransferase [Pseudomonas syringae group]MBI6848633.1 GNAT family N-acetyltransferase [Pseudomonas syringae]TES52357.1 N-acetyltransferase [Pseudomonas syringae pv. tomato]